MQIKFYWIIAVLFIGACGGGDSGNNDANSTGVSSAETVTAYTVSVPPGFPLPKILEDNPLSAEKVTLGKRLFYDNRMSSNNTMSCASCHLQSQAFTDGLLTSVGSTGEVHPRNSMTLTNAVYNSRLNWANPMIKTLQAQALIPMLGESPIELGWSGNEQKILDSFRVDPLYRDEFVQAFPGEVDPFTAGYVAKAIAAFVSTLISGNSAFDKSLYQNDSTAMSDSAKRGRDLFFSERLECFHCHGGFNFSQSVNHSGTVFDEVEFHNNGLYNIGGTGAYPDNNRGLWEFTFKAEDMGRFRAPTLRNVELTAPYMHDGSIATLEEVIDHYARGGRQIESGEYAGDGARNPFKSELINGFVLTEAEKTDLLNFLKSLTDWEFVCDKRFSDPFGNQLPHPNCPQL
ncbi:MAG: di-heme enzyme [Thioploca sp.]|nr:di-heme enzyme [Thioploca sp.]